MPQLIPLYFVHESITALILLSVMIYFASKYILPRFVRMFYTRLILHKL